MKMIRRLFSIYRRLAEIEEERQVARDNGDAAASDRLEGEMEEILECLKATMGASWLLTLEEAAAYLGVAPGTLAKWTETGKHGLPVVVFDREIRYRKIDLDQWLGDHVIVPVPVAKRRVFDRDVRKLKAGEPTASR